MSEDRLYEPVRNCLQKEFVQFGECEFEITEKNITEKAKAWLDDAALFFIRVEKKLPDLIGRFKPDPSKSPPYGFYEGLIIAEVKNVRPTIKGIFQTKLYAEVFDAPYAFLISSKEMMEEMRRFLSKRYLLLSYGAYRRVYIAKFDVTTQTIDERWYPECPFKRD